VASILADVTNIAVTKEEIDEDDIPQQDTIHCNEKINIIALPTIVTIPLCSKNISATVKKIGSGFYNYYVFLSAHSVNIFFNAIEKEKNSSSILQEITKENKENNNRFIAIGPKTKKAIEKRRLESSFATATIANHNANSIKLGYSLSSIMKFLDDLDKSNEGKKEKTKILMPRSAESQKSNNIVTKTYSNLILDQVFFYETVEYDKTEESHEWDRFYVLVRQKKLKSIIFTSPSAVRAFFKIITNSITHHEKQLSLLLPPTVQNEQHLMNCLGIKTIVSIGPKTSEELKKREIDYSESEEHTVKGAINHLLEKMQ
jgi:uroporphyrinogen-III synthase